MSRLDRQDLARLEQDSPRSAASATTRRLGEVSASNVFTTTRAGFLVNLDDGGSIVAVNLGVLAPSTGTRVVLDLVDGDWTFQHDE